MWLYVMELLSKIFHTTRHKLYKNILTLFMLMFILLHIILWSWTSDHIAFHHEDQFSVDPIWQVPEGGDPPVQTPYLSETLFGSGSGDFQTKASVWQRLVTVWNKLFLRYGRSIFHLGRLIIALNGDSCWHILAPGVIFWIVIQRKPVHPSYRSFFKHNVIQYSCKIWNINFLCLV